MTLHRSAAFSGGDTSTSPRLGARVLQTPECFINWHAGRRSLTVTARGHKAGGLDDYPEWTFEGADGVSALIVFQVAFLRGGVHGLREVLREVFDPRSQVAEGIYFAERNSYRRVNGRIVRDMEG